MSITIIPAIDLKNGKCVRLRQGRPEDATEYSDDPVAMAQQWAAEGARYLHVVDLDGAFEGKPVHVKEISAIAAAVDIPVEVGGGLRTDADIETILKCGVKRAIVGTRAWEEPESLKNLVREFGEQLAVGIDARDGMVQIKGWTETTGVAAVDLAAQADDLGVYCIIYTDTSKDGMLAGVNARAVDAICEAVSCDVVASGGVSSVEDVVALTDLHRENLVGAIVGKALYEGQVSLKELQAL